jgi:hypothetical protein
MLQTAQLTLLELSAIFRKIKYIVGHDDYAKPRRCAITETPVRKFDELVTRRTR